MLCKSVHRNHQKKIRARQIDTAFFLSFLFSGWAYLRVYIWAINGKMVKYWNATFILYVHSAVAAVFVVVIIIVEMIKWKWNKQQNVYPNPYKIPWYKMYFYICFILIWRWMEFYPLFIYLHLVWNWGRKKWRKREKMFRKGLSFYGIPFVEMLIRITLTILSENLKMCCWTEKRTITSTLSFLSVTFPLVFFSLLLCLFLSLLYPLNADYNW